jgi:alpha-glucosidase
LPNTAVAHEDMRDPLGVRYFPYYEGRDAARTPMPWSDASGGGFTDPDVRPWLPLGDVHACNVAAQHADPDSVLRFVRALLARRRRAADLRTGSYRARPAPEGVWAWNRGDRHFVAINMTDEPVVVSDIDGTLRIGTAGPRAGEQVEGTLALAPWEGVIGETPPP